MVVPRVTYQARGPRLRGSSPELNGRPRGEHSLQRVGHTDVPRGGVDGEPLKGRVHDGILEGGVAGVHRRHP